MKKIILLILTVVLTSCNLPKEATLKDTAVVKKECDSILNNWHLAATNADYDAYFSILEDNSVFVGTDASEVWNKKEFQQFSKPYFDRGKAWDFKTVDRNIYISDTQNLIWFDEILDTWMGICRGSGVIGYKNNTYTLKHYVLSVTVSNDDINSVVQVKKRKDSIFLHHFIKDIK